MRSPSLELVNDYAEAVTRGDVVVGELVRLACQRHLDDLEKSKQKTYPYAFDVEKAARAINFVELMPHTKGKWAAKGQKLILEPWQRFIIGCIFGWVKKSDGNRRFREAYIEVPRKNGKSVLAAAVGLYCFVADGEYGAEVYSGATTERQSWEVFRPAKQMASRLDVFKDFFGVEVNASNMVRLEDFSRFEPLIGKPGDGASPHCAIIDEFHEHAGPDLHDTMQTGMGAREQPLMFIITTAGSNIGGPCYEKRTEMSKVLRGVFDDDRVFAAIYSLDDGDDWTQPEMWAKANPGLGISVSQEFLESQVQSALRSPSKQQSVRTKHFNQWTGAKSQWLNMEHWNKQATTLTVEDFEGEPSYIGLDLATRMDIAARVSLFWRDVKGQRHYYLFPTFYLPEDALLSSKNAKMYQGWAASGYINLLDGAEIDLNGIQEDILGLASSQTIEEVVYDPWQATQLAQSLRAERVTAVEYRNTVGNLSPPMRELEAALAAGRLWHPDNPVFNWMASNVVAKADAKDNIFPRKENPESKIDGMVAALFAMGRAMHAEERKAHAYETRGFRTL